MGTDPGPGTYVETRKCRVCRLSRVSIGSRVACSVINLSLSRAGFFGSVATELCHVRVARLYLDRIS